MLAYSFFVVLHREKELDDQIESLQEQLTSSMSKTQLLESQLLHFSTPSRLFRFLKSVLNVLLTFFAVLLAQGFNLFMFFKYHFFALLL